MMEKYNVKQIILENKDKDITIYIEFIKDTKSIEILKYRGVFYNKRLALYYNEENEKRVDIMIKECINHGYTKTTKNINKWIMS